MAVLHRALFTWFNLLIFLILLVLRLDQRIQWNWFIVFIPMWLYDNILLIYIVFNMISHCRDGCVNILYHVAWYVIAVLLKLCAQILICLKLEAPHWSLPTKVVLAPFWLVLHMNGIMKHHFQVRTMWLFILFHSLFLLQKSETATDIVTVKEVTAGHLAELPCLSIDEHHRFMFWQFGNNDVIGPGNPLNEKKYNYEVLTGILQIRGVSTAESGFYKCVSKGLFDDSQLRVHSVELIVKNDWEQLWETDFETNLLRGMSAVMVLVVAAAVVLLIVTVKRKRSQRFFDLEESRENSPTRYTSNNTPGVSSDIENVGIDNTALDIDFPKVFKQMHKEQAMP